MATLPKGISATHYTDTAGKTQTRYRFRKSTKKLSVDKYFDTLEEAINFKLTIEKSGNQAELERVQADYSVLMNALTELTTNPDFQTIYNIYTDRILKPVDSRESSLLAYKSNKSRLHKMMSVMIDVTATEGFLSSRDKQLKPLGQFTLKDFSEQSVKAFISAEIEAGKAKGTIEKELTLLNNMLNSYCYEYNQDWTNPIYNVRKTALKKIRTKKRIRYLTEVDKEEIQSKLKAKNNKQLSDIVLLSIFTSLRRSEIIALQWKDIFDDYVLIEDSKNGESREVYLTPEAKQIIANIDKAPNQPKLFTYTIEGFKTAWQRFQRTLTIEKVNFHDFRKAFITDTIQKQIEQSGIASVFAIGTAIGAKDLDYLAKQVDREQQKYNHKKRNNFIETEEELRANSAHKDYRTQKIYTTKLTIK